MLAPAPDGVARPAAAPADGRLPVRPGKLRPGVDDCSSDWAASMAVAESMPLAAATAARLDKAAESWYMDGDTDLD